ncbi:MAG: Amidohydro-rel protein [Chloroflexi bacterium]|nr:Amidohydro-rel protein [Chloroflexota bacterium]
MAREYRVISADSHVDLNPEVWAHRVPARWRDRAPKRVVLPHGSDGVVCDGGEAHGIGLTRNVGVPYDEMPFQVPKFSEPVGNGTPELRLVEQDRDGIDAEIMFTGADGLLRDAKDDDLYLALIRAYNEYMAEEYMAVAPDRLIPMGLLPTTGVDHAVNELEHCARLGLKGVMLSRLPSGRGYPTPEDDRFWAAALDLRMPLSKHSGGRWSGSWGNPTETPLHGAHRGPEARRSDPPFLYPHVIENPDNHKNDAIGLLLDKQINMAYGALQIAYAGVWDRFPKLQMYWAETMSGWIPYSMFMLDDNYRRYHAMISHFWGMGDLERMPSEYLREHTLWGTLYDPVGVQGRAAIGADNILFSTDFPHANSFYPNTRTVIEDMFAGCTESDRRQILAGNAIRYWHLDE